MSKSLSIITTCLLIFFIHIDIKVNCLNRIKRKLPLIYPGYPDRRPEYVIISGFGIPLKNLHYETVTTGVVFKARYFLPKAAHQLYHHNTTNLHLVSTAKKFGNERSQKMERSVSNNNNSFRWHFYKLLEYWLNHLGLNGHSCVLKSICETIQNPFHLDSGHLWQELAHILFQPQTSSDNWPKNLPSEYLKASELNGNITCYDLYKNCPFSLLNQITNIF